MLSPILRQAPKARGSSPLVWESAEIKNGRSWCTATMFDGNIQWGVGGGGGGGGGGGDGLGGRTNLFSYWNNKKVGILSAHASKLARYYSDVTSLTSILITFAFSFFCWLGIGVLRYFHLGDVVGSVACRSSSEMKGYKSLHMLQETFT
jgi:hypothetical protein